MICSFECTYCLNCARDVLDFWCPNCGGALAPRPTRAERLLEKYPVAKDRTFNPGCAERRVAWGLRGEPDRPDE